MEIRQRVREVHTEDGWALVKVLRVPDQPGIAARIFGTIAEAGVSVDIILQNASVNRMTDVSFTVRQEDVARAAACVKDVTSSIGAAGVETRERLAKVQIVGTGILSDPTIVGHMFRALADAQVNILAIATSEIRISCLIAQEERGRAEKALRAAFEATQAA